MRRAALLVLLFICCLRPVVAETVSERVRQAQQMVLGGRFAEAEHILLACLTVLRSMPKTAEQTEALAACLGASGLGGVRYGQERYADAIPLLEEALPLDRKLQEPFAQLALDTQTLGYCYWKIGKYAAARPVLLESASAYEAAGDVSLSVTLLRQAALTCVEERGSEGWSEALKLFDEALKQAEQNKLAVPAAQVHEYIGRCAVLYGGGGGETLRLAVSHLTAALSLPQSERVSATRFLAHALAALHHDEEALQRYQECLRSYQDLHLPDRVAQIQDELGLFHFERAHWGSAIECWEAFLWWLDTPAGQQSYRETHVGKAAADPRVAAMTTLDLLARLYWLNGRPQDTLRKLERKSEIAKEVGDRTEIFNTLWLRSLYSFALGQEPPEGVEQAASTDDQHAMMLLLVMLRDGKEAPFDVVHRALLEILPKVQALPPQARQGFASAWAVWGVMQSRLGHLADGVEALETAVSLALPQVRLAMMSEIGHAYFRSGHLQAALDADNAALREFQTLARYQELSTQIYTLLEIVCIQRALKDDQASRATLDRAAELAAPVRERGAQMPGDRRVLAYLVGAQAEQRWRDGDSDGAMQLCREALADYSDETDEGILKIKAILATVSGQSLLPIVQECVKYKAYHTLVFALQQPMHQDAGGLWECIKTVHDPAEAEGQVYCLPYIECAGGRALEALGEPGHAETAYRSSIDNLEALSGNLQADAAKIGLRESGDDATSALLELLLRQGREAEALRMSERGRGRAFLDMLATADLSDLLGQAGEADLQHMRRQLQRAYLTSQPLALEGILPVSATRLQTRDSLSGKDVSLTLPAASLPRTIPAKTDVAGLLEALRQRRSAMAGSDSELASLVTVPASSVERLRALAKRENATVLEYFMALRHLHIFVMSPGGEIHQVSTSTTADEVNAAVHEFRRALGRTDGDVDAALGRLHRLLLKPVAAYLPTSTKQAPLLCVVPHRSLFLVPFAALRDESGHYLVEKYRITSVPALSVLQYTGKKERPLQPKRPSSVLLVGNPQMPTSLPPLPAAEAEVAAIAKAFPAAAVALIGRAATRAAVAERMADAQLIHLATHGVLDADDPMRSFLALTGGKLTVQEIFRLHLHASLVTLSACDTGLGRISGDGVMGLSRAFIYAGTPSVMVSLWPVEDESTARQMEEFYRLLAAGVAKSDALRQAQLSVMKAFPSPRRWAPFCLVGEGR